MNVTRIATPLDGEHVLAVAPKPAPFVDAHWRRRLNCFTGRTLSDTALRAEQQNRAGRLATLGQALSPGIVRGLEASLEGTGANAWINVASGLGLTITGEDVLLPRALRVKLGDLLPSSVPADLRAGILVLAPVEMQVFGRGNPEDPCEVDEAEIAFVDEQWIDAAELLFLPWDLAWSEGAALTSATAARNALAHYIFERERQKGANEYHPWQQQGVPLALLGLDGAAAVYLDRFAVVRSGGLPRARSAWFSEINQRSGTPQLWQARLQQLIEHVADLQDAATPIEAMREQLGFLPPGALLPREALTLEPSTERPSTRQQLAVRNRFFPNSFSLWVAPLPLEQLDGVLERCASLAPLSSAASERVLVIAPVPQAVYEPELLIEEAVDPAFQTALDQFISERDDALGRQEYLRKVILILTTATDGIDAVPQYPEPDPDEPEVLPTLEGEDSYDLDFSQPVPAPRSIMALHTFLGGLSVLSEAELEELNQVGLAAFANHVQRKVDGANDVVDFAFLKAHSDIYRVRQLMLGNTVGTRLAASPALASIALGESAAAVRADINNFYLSLKGRLPLSTLETSPLTEARAIADTAAGQPAPELIAEKAMTFAAAPAAAARSGASLPDVGRFVESVSAERAIGAGAIVGGQLVGARATVSAEPSLGAAARRETVLVAQPPPERVRVQSAPALIGEGAYDFRTVSIVKRLDDPVAQESKAHAVSNRFEAISMLARLVSEGLNIGEVMVQGLPARREKPEDAPKFDPSDNAPPFAYDDNGLPIRVSAQLSIVMQPLGLKALLNDPPPLAPSESTFFAEALRVLENNIATLRAVEARLAAYETVVDHCADTLEIVRGLISEATSRLGVVDGDLQRARHGIITVRALMEDEGQRVDALNARRRAVLAEHLRFFAYVRPRSAEAVLDVPAMPLNPGIVEPVVGNCLTAHDDPPPELERMVQLLREAPVAWFKNLPAIIDRLDRPELLRGTIASAQLRARSMLAAPSGSPGGALTFVHSVATAPLAASIAKATKAQQAVINSYRLELAQLDLGGIAALGWRETRERVVRVVSLGDLIEANHGRMPVAQAAQRELEQIGAIATCLHAQISEILPVIRLAWAERLSQYEAPVPLGNLSALPRWAAVDPLTGQPEIPYADRKQIQSLVDWLYARVNPANAEAAAWMNDLVRVCILLASHAPVDEIVAGRVPVAASVSPGGSLPVEIDPGRVKIGMKVMFFDGAQLLAHGLVEDIVGQQALARVVETHTPSVSLAANAKAHFVPANSRFAPTFFRK